MPCLEEDMGFKMGLLILRQHRQSCKVLCFPYYCQKELGVTVDDCRIICGDIFLKATYLCYLGLL